QKSTMSIEVEHDCGIWDWPMNANDGVVQIHNDPEKFEVHIDAQHFTPAEIEVKVIGRLVDIHAEHKSRQGPHGSIARSLNRTYKLPEDVNEHAIKSFLSPRGTLVITAFKKSNTSYPRILLEDDAW
ncbi:hypothetical protein PENTCL1PPCAC_4723, partial [Pristionchus entomophagus]